MGKAKYISRMINGKVRTVHRYLVEQKIGRPLRKDEIVHHINGNTRDNRLKNLEITNHKKHCNHHNRVKREDFKCDWCKKNFLMRKREYLWKKKNQKNVFCSRRCNGLYYSNLGNFPNQNNFRYKNIDSLIIEGKKLNKSCYRIAKDNNLNNVTVLNHWKRIKSLN
jgi:hypothetical protein